MEEKSRKRNMSFSISFDLNDSDDESCSDSESTGLQIDISEVDNFNSSNKLTKQSIEQPNFLNEMEEEIQCQLDAKAARTNLTATNVKNIIKQVLMHEQVVEMCHQKLTKGDGDFTFDLEPRLTRAKAKELAIVLPYVPLPQKNADPEVQALVQEEILEDSSDEEYNPEQDPLNEEDKDVENSVGSDIDSQPSTPATPCDLSNLEMPLTPDIQNKEDEIVNTFQISSHQEPLKDENLILYENHSKLRHETPVEVMKPFVTPDLCWEDDDNNFGFDLEPRFTRAKAKELAKEPDIILPQTNLSPEVKALRENLEILEDLLNNLEPLQLPDVTSSNQEICELSEIPKSYQFTPEVQALVQEEISSEDSSDEDYNPEKDIGSDIDSQPSTPATECDLSAILELLPLPEVQYDEEGIFKIPQKLPLHLTAKEERPISHSTRSKVKLDETPIEVIEQSLVAPDVTTDQCYWDLDPDYTTFLNSTYYQPLPREDVDDPDDPEYIQLEVEDNEEELKKGKGFEIPMEEVKSLIAELSDFADQYIDIKQQEERKQQLQKTSLLEEIESNVSETDFQFTFEQRRLLSVQMSFHVQLLAQQFLMTYHHPQLHQQSEICKNFLLELKKSSYTTSSAFMALNLDEALKLISDWESKMSDLSFLEEYVEWLKSEIETAHIFANSKRKYKINFHYELIKLMCNSRALMHPILIPELFVETNPYKLGALLSEEHLIAIGLEEYIPIVKKRPRKFTEERFVICDALEEVRKYLTPIRNLKYLISLVKTRRNGKMPKNCNFNPIKYYFTNGHAPKINHRFLDNYELVPPIKQLNYLSPRWQNYVENLNNGHLKELLSSPNNTKRNNYDIGNSLLDTQIEVIIPPLDHELRNPVVNMMKRLSSIMSTQKNEPNKKSVKTSNCKSKPSRSKTNEIESDTETSESLQTCEMNEEESRTSRLRMTSPRLAKIKSVQNMKLLAQNMTSKSSNSNPSSSKIYDKNDDSSSFAKGDNEDEIAELMLASTTIKKNTSNRKKSKQARELENLKRLYEAENNINEDERATKFAASFIQKLHDYLETKDPDLLKTIEKILADYSEKLENLNQSNDIFLSNLDSGYESNNTLTKETVPIDKDKLSINLYKEIYEKLREFKDLTSDLLLFLTPNQAALIDQSVEYTMLVKMKQFVNIFQNYFAKQPSRTEKIMQAISQASMDPYITLEKTISLMGTALKGHPLIMELFVQSLPQAKPPESLFAEHMFENLTCPVGPHDKNKAYDEDSPELYENIELPVLTPQEDPYGGDSCKCNCHNFIDDLKSKGTNEHCASCGTKFLNGRIYLQTSEGLRPAKITFPGEDDEKLENISRVSLKMTERIIPCQPPKKRRKVTKRDSISEEPNAKPGPSKNSPSKSIDEIDKTMKLKKGTKSPPKSTEQKKSSKLPSIGVKSIREKKSDKKLKELKSEQKTDDEQIEFSVITDQSGENLVNIKCDEISTDSHEDDNSTTPDKVNISSTSNERLMSSDSETSEILESEVSTAWTIQEDKIVLEQLQKEYSEKSFLLISSTLENRSIEQVRERCQYLLLQLIEKEKEKEREKALK